MPLIVPPPDADRTAYTAALLKMAAGAPVDIRTTLDGLAYEVDDDLYERWTTGRAEAAWSAAHEPANPAPAPPAPEPDPAPAAKPKKTARR